MKPPASHDSFTLIELVVVMALLGIFASLVAVNLHGFGANARLDSAARMVSDIVALARNEAGVTGRVWSVHYEVGGKRMKMRPPEGHGDISSRALPRDVQFQAVALGGSLLSKDGWVSVDVRPDGLLTPHTVYVEDSAGDMRTISVNPATGTVRISQGKVEPGKYVLPSSKQRL
jgi:prepilin-type N-terminal cleavage/methylation domain-containing protein